MPERTHLSIGEVLSLLREEFPDVTISKIRFLESQGLVDPERTPSGYRKFYDHDVERLRWILRQQRENFLPLKVIRGRLSDQGEQPTLDDALAESGGGGASPAGDRDGLSASEVVAPTGRDERAGRDEPSQGEKPFGAVDPDATGPLVITDAGLSDEPGAIHRHDPPTGSRVDDTDTGGSEPDRAESAGRDRAADAGAAEGRAGRSTGREASGGGSSAAGSSAAGSSAGGSSSGGFPSAGSGGSSAGGSSAGRPAAGGPSAGGSPSGGRRPASSTGPAGPERRAGGVGAGTRAAAVGSPTAASEIVPAPAGDQADASNRSGRASGTGDDESYTSEELAAAADAEVALVRELQQFGLIAAHATVAGVPYFGPPALAVTRAAARFAQHGIEARHLRAWRNAADREATLYEQIVMPLLRQRNPSARQQAADTLAELAGLGADLRDALLQRAIAQIR